MKSDEPSTTIYVPSDVWTVIPHADVEVYQNSGRVCQVKYYFDTKCMSLLDSPVWQVQPILRPRECYEELQQVQSDS